MYQTITYIFYKQKTRKSSNFSLQKFLLLNAFRPKILQLKIFRRVTELNRLATDFTVFDVVLLVNRQIQNN